MTVRKIPPPSIFEKTLWFFEDIEKIGKPEHTEYASRCVAQFEDKTLTDQRRQYLPHPITVPETIAFDIHGDISRIYAGKNAFWYEQGVERRKRQQEARRETLEWRKKNGRVRARDSQRKRLYAAEQVIRELGSRFSSDEEVQRYVNRVTSTAWFKRRWAMRRDITVAPGRNNRAATAYLYRMKIVIPPWARCPAVVLHEIAHICTGIVHGDDQVAAHGREYASIFLELVRHEMGDDAWRALKASFVEKKVKHTLPRKVNLTPEQRAAAAERLALARAAKAKS